MNGTNKTHIKGEINMSNKSPIIQRGDLFIADLNPTVGSEQSGVRPVLVIQNNIGNVHSPMVIVIIHSLPSWQETVLFLY